MPQKIDMVELAGLLIEKAVDRRILVAIAGPPGSGKSTLAAKLTDILNFSDPGSAVLVPMDGYHLDDHLLTRLGRISRKGAPDTFDVGGLIHMLGRLLKNAEDEIVIPEFDRDLEIARAGSRMINKECNIIVVEGNYLLLDLPPWNALESLFDLTVMLETKVDVLRERLLSRWVGHGLSETEVARKLEENDIPNGILVVEKSNRSDFVLES